MMFANKYRGVVLSIILLAQANNAMAFYNSEKDSSYIDARALLRGYVNYLDYRDPDYNGPDYSSSDDTVLYPEGTSTDLAGIARLMIEGGFSYNWSYDINIYQTYISNDLVDSPGQNSSLVGVERSSLLETSLTDDAYARLVLDQLSLRWSGEKTDITLGRQAINLATNYYFTPNDFFSPFAAQTFFRVYKPGVDAIRIEHSLGDFSQLSFITVAGYGLDLDGKDSSVDGSTGSDSANNNSANNSTWSKTQDSSRSSYIATYSGVYGNAEYGLIGGALSDKKIVGGSLQGEWLKWLGYRIEGHYAMPDTNEYDNYSEVSIGLEHRWENTLTLRMELYHNGQGYDSIDDYLLSLQVSETDTSNDSVLTEELYLTKKYLAFGANYEITPLLIGDALLIRNVDDQSSLLSLNAVYSLSDESELALSFNLPVGDEPEEGVLKSEFGSYPQTFNIEFRQYW